MPHVGNMLREFLKTSQIKSVALAKSLQKQEASMTIFKRKQTCQASTLWDISNALHYNFFQDLASQLPPEFKHQPNANTSLIEQLQKENEQLRSDKLLLERILMGRNSS